MHRFKLALIAVAAIGSIASFLPWENISVLGTVSDTRTGTEIVESVLGTKGVGWITLALFVMVALIATTGKIAEPIKLSKKWIVVTIAILTIIIAVHTLLDVKQKTILNPQDAGGLSFESTPGIGIYLAIVAGAVILLTALLTKSSRVTSA